MEVYNKKLEELAEVKEINLVLMDTLIVSLTWVLQYTDKNNIPLPEMNGIKSLLRTVRMLTEEGQHQSLNLQHLSQTPSFEAKTLSDESLQVANPTQTLQNLKMFNWFYHGKKDRQCRSQPNCMVCYLRMLVFYVRKACTL